jgi:hypothetical protein
MILKINHRRDVPPWLRDIRLSTPHDLERKLFPLKEAIKHSLYYPAAGCDGRPVQFLGGFIHSFFYVDYGMSKAKIDEEALHSGFKGYKISGQKRLNQADLAPGGWSPIVPQRFHDEMAKFDQFRRNGFVTTPFASWYVFDRDPGLGEDHGPQRFSLVYIAGDGVATYQALYWLNDTAPEVLAIIQPGHGFGGNYTDFTNPNGFLAWTVLDKERKPEYLVCGGKGLHYAQAFWPDAYPKNIERFQRENGNGVWRRKQAADCAIEPAAPMEPE